MSAEAAPQESDDEMGALFDDPEGYYPPTPPGTRQKYTLRSGETVTLHLVGHSPGEAHHLWNGARVVSDFFEADPALVRGKTVLELGAGAGLPCLVAGLLGAARAVVTDFPDPDLVANMQKNVDEADEALGKGGDLKGRVVPAGFVWGADPARLLALLPEESTGTGTGTGTETGGDGAESRQFDVLILADLLFRHSEHGRQVKTIKDTLSRGGTAYVFFTSYRPWLQHKDLAFFDVAREAGFVVDKVLERKMERPLFEGDPGDVEVLKTVMGFTVRWPADGS